MSNISEATNPDKRQRFSVYVPNPSASFQLGAADYANKFGYNGGALSVDPFLFIDVNKHMLFQTGTHSCWQVGGKWLQYANGPMYMTSLEHTTVGAGLKMLLVAGAAQGQITALVHRKDGTPRIVEYNNLTTRYRVEEQANNVVRFLHGRKTMKDLSGADGEAIDGPDNMKTGMVAISDATSTALGLAQPALEALDTELGRSHFRMYYPYAKKSKIGILNALYTALNKMYRFRDVLQKYLWWLTDNALVATVTKLLEAANHLFGVYHNLQLFINNAVMDFASKNNATTGEREWGWDDNRFAREAKGDDGQGWGARLKHAQNIHARHYARVTSAGAPYDFTKERSYETLTVHYDSGSTVFAASNLPTTAHVVGTTPTTFAGKKWTAASTTMPATATTLTITVGSGDSAPTVQVPFTAGETVTLAQMASKIAAADTSTPKKLGVVHKPNAVYVHAADESSALTLTWSQAPASSFTDASLLSGMGGLSFLLTVDHAVSQITFSATDITLDEVAARINQTTGHTDPAVASVVAGKLDLLSLRSGKKRSNLIVEPVSGLLSKIGLSACMEVGANGHASVADWEAVTIAEVKSYLASSADHIEHEADASDFKLRSTTYGVGSEVRVIDDNATADVLGFSGKKDKIDGDDFNMTTPGDLIQSWRSCVFELNKLPEDTRNILRPLVEAIDDVNGLLASAAGVVDSIASIAGLWTGDERDPSVATIVGRDGISMGTNDSLVGVASKGVCFYATGAAGVVDQREFIAGIEKPLNKIPVIPKLPLLKSLTELTDLEAPDSFAANVGFQVRSAADIAMRAVDVAELLAVGRDENGDGVGTARLGGSRSAEVMAEKTAALTARAKGGRVELLGDRITIGCADAGLGDVDIKSTWADATKQVVTTDIQVEAKATASIGVSGYLVYAIANDAAAAMQQQKQLLRTEKDDKDKEVRVKTRAIAKNKIKIRKLGVTILALERQVVIDDNHPQKLRDKQDERDRLRTINTELDQEVQAATVRSQDLAGEIAALDEQINEKQQGGVLIAARNPAKKRFPLQDKPSFLLSDQGITLRSSTQAHGAAEAGTKVDLKDDQVILTQGNDKWALAVSADGILFKSSASKKVLDISGAAVTLQDSVKVDFAKANKILLG